MPKAYWVNTVRAMHDPDKVARYVELAGPALRAAGGRFLARGMPSATFESGLQERTVVVEFESVERAVAAYESEAYRRALGELGDGADRDLRIVEGAAESS